MDRKSHKSEKKGPLGGAEYFRLGGQIFDAVKTFYRDSTVVQL